MRWGTLRSKSDMCGAVILLDIGLWILIPVNVRGWMPISIYRSSYNLTT